MADRDFSALVVRSSEPGACGVERLTLDALPEGDVLVEVAFSSVNYKDALAVTGQGKVVRRFPMVPGIDLAGTVHASSSPAFSPGQRVLVTGWGIGEEHWGGFAQMARVEAAWLTRVPPGLDLEQAMAIGTAGFTAMLAVMALTDHGLETASEVLVTGAGGGLGGIAVALLASLGHRVVAVTGRPDELRDYLTALGASAVVSRAELTRASRPLESERWAGAIDAVGGSMLATVLSQMRYGTAVAACGLAGGSRLETTVFPFILRGIALLGINSVFCPVARREDAWRRLATHLPLDTLATMVRRVSLAEVIEASDALLRGAVRGRLVVDVNGD